ncbi:MAG: YraN family protein [Acidimicrobiales bacterium]|nr:YraN family protein [Acidimicrobiales bacterium]
MTAGRQRLGRSGEDRAAKWYEDHGYLVVERNWRCRQGEVDLIVRKGSTTVFCEVKTRSSLAYGHPAEAVTPSKQKRIRMLATKWLAEVNEGPRPQIIRFDVAAVLPSEVSVIEDAF